MLASLIYRCLGLGVVVGEADGYTFYGDDGTTSFLAQSLFWSAPLLFELLLMSLAIFKAAEHWRMTSGLIGPSLVKVLIEDQAIYFITVLMCSAVQIVEYWAFRRSTGISSNQVVNILVDVAGSSVFPCIVGNQLIFHLKEAAEKGVNGGTSYRARTVSDIQFV